MASKRVVIDTNVIVSALRSNRGTSYELLRLVEKGEVIPVLTVPLIFEYEEVLLRQASSLGLTPERIASFLDSLCAMGEERTVFFLWRPVLKDVDDDLVLEAAVAGQVDYLATFNVQDFVGAEKFGIQVVRPRELIRIVGAPS